MSACEACSEDMGDLRRVRVELAVAADSAAVIAAERSPWGWLSWTRVLGGLSALGAAAAIAWVMTPAAGPAPESGPRIADGTDAPPRHDLRDGALRLVVDAEGRLGGLPAGVPDDARAEAELALAGALPPSTALNGLRGPAGALMGGTPDAAAFGPLSPVGTVVESDRPLFRWSAMPGASRYRGGDLRCAIRGGRAQRSGHRHRVDAGPAAAARRHLVVAAHRHDGPRRGAGPGAAGARGALPRRRCAHGGEPRRSASVPPAAPICCWPSPTAAPASWTR